MISSAKPKKSNPWIVSVVGVLAFVGGGQIIHYIYAPARPVSVQQRTDPPTRGAPTPGGEPTKQPSVAEAFLDAAPQAVAPATGPTPKQ